MRNTLHEYVIEMFDDGTLENTFCIKCNNYAKLTNRAPRLGDFIECDEEGNVLERPKPYRKWLKSWQGEDGFEDCERYQAAQKKIIFKGDWEVDEDGENYIFLRDANRTLVQFRKRDMTFRDEYGKEITRIEDLPREVEFKNDVI